MDDEEKLQSEIDLVSGDETGTPTRGATTGTDEGTGETGTTTGGEEDKGSGSVSGDSGNTGKYTLSVVANPVAGASSVTVRKGNEAKAYQSIEIEGGAQYTLNATAATGYTFSGWYLNNALQSSTTPYLYTAPSTVSQNLQFEARFESSQGGGDSGTTVRTPEDVTELFSTPNAEYDVDITINYLLSNPISNISVKLNGVTIPVEFSNKTTGSSIQTIHVIYHYTQPDVIPHEGGLQFEMLFTQNNVQYHKYYGIGSPTTGWEHPVSGQSDY